MQAKVVYGDIIRFMKPVDISPLVKKYGASYIARSKKSGKVVAHAKRIDILIKKTKKRSDVTISWVPRENVRYAWSVYAASFGKKRYIRGRI